MKKYLFMLALGAFSPVLPSVLAQETTPAPQVAPEVQAAPAAAPFLWQLRLKAGQKWETTLEISNEQQISTPAAGAKSEVPMTSLSSTRMVMDQNVLSSDEKGARVEVVYRELSQKTKSKQGDKVIYDSENPPAAMKNMNINAMAEAIQGAKISFVIAPDGQISDIEGIEDYIEHLKAGLDKALGTDPGMAASKDTMTAALSSFVSPETLKSSFGAAYSAMPKTSVAPGESWKYETKLPMLGSTFTQSGQGTFVSRLDGVVSIAQKGTFATDPGAEFKVPIPAKDKNTPAPITQLDLSGEMNSEITIDENSGMTLSSHATQNLEGEMVMSGLTGKGSVISVPMKMKMESTSKTREISAEVKTTP